MLILVSRPNGKHLILRMSILTISGKRQLIVTKRMLYLLLLIFWIKVIFSFTYLENLFEFFINYSLLLDVEVVNSIHFLLGQCQTFYPKVYPSIVSKETGYAVLLNHSMTDIDKTPSTVPPGYHVFIHETDEPFAGSFILN